MMDDDSQASMRRLCSEAERDLGDRQSEFTVPSDLPSDFMTDKYRIEMVSNHFQIVTYEESKEPSEVDPQQPDALEQRLNMVIREESKVNLQDMQDNLSD